jgi:CRP-like cAMP-binding protein
VRAELAEITWSFAVRPPFDELMGSSLNFDSPDLLAQLIGGVTEGARVEDAATSLSHALSLSLTFEEIFARFEHFLAGSINLTNVLALMGAIFFVATLLMRTIIPLRVSAIIADLFFVAYAVLANSVSTFFLYILLLPINSLRLYQMLKLVKKARQSAQGDLSMDWLKPFMNRRKYRTGELVFRKGDAANEMFYTVSGKFLVKEIAITLPAGKILGELGFLSPNNRRTQTVECIETGEVLAITYDKLLEIYFQNQEFGYYFLRLSSERLLQNVARLEAIIEQNNKSAAVPLEAATARNGGRSDATVTMQASGDGDAPPMDSICHPSVSTDVSPLETDKTGPDRV